MSRTQHDRTDLHTGYDTDVVITISEIVGANVVGTDLHTVLAYLDSWISGRETVTPQIGSVTANSIVKRTEIRTGTADAIFRRTPTASFTADGFVLGYLRLNSIVLRSDTRTFTLKSEIVDLHYFRINAVIVRTSTAFDSSAFDPTAFA